MQPCAGWAPDYAGLQHMKFGHRAGSEGRSISTFDGYDCPNEMIDLQEAFFSA